MVKNFNTLRKLFTNDADEFDRFVSIVSNIENSELITFASNYLSDTNISVHNISSEMKIDLVKLINSYYDSCSDLILFDDIDLEKLFNASVEDIYYVNASDGLRVATVKEVENGVLGLTIMKNYTIGVDKHRLLALLLWTITGNVKYFRSAGFDYEHKIINNINYGMIKIAYAELQDMIKWVSSKNFKDDTIKLKSVIKRGKYKYPDFAYDEIKANMTVKQLMYYLGKNLPRKSDDKNVKRAWHLILSVQNGRKYKLSPMDISLLRSLSANLNSLNRTNDKLKRECEEILKAGQDGIISTNSFVFKIINTLKANEYKKVSTKQYNIIKDALDRIQSAKQNQKITESRIDELDDTDEDDDLSLVAISDNLGNGVGYVD